MEFFGDYYTSIKKAFSETDKKWEKYQGVVIAGTHQPKIEEIDLLLEKIKTARENNVPLYAECYGFQLVSIEYARNVLGIKNATSEEWGIGGNYVVRKRIDGLNVGLKDGESYWNNYEVSIGFPVPKHFFIAQYHASYQSSIKKPHKLIKEFLKYAKGHTRKMAM